MTNDIDLDIEDIKPSISPTLFDINCSFDSIKTDNYDGLVGEEEARMVIFTNFVLGEKPVILKGSRSSGKTAIMSIVSTYAKNPIVISSSSEKVYNRMEDLNKFTHFVIPEINQIHEKVVEMLKSWGEGSKHQYSYLDPSKNAVTVYINPKPFMTSIADENKNVDLLGEELLSRLTVVRTSSSVEQNVRVINEKLLRAQNPLREKIVDQKLIDSLISYVKGLPSIKDFIFVYPPGTVMRTAIPALFTDSRRDTDKYLANTKGITLFHYYDRMVKEIKGKKILFITPVDVWLNYIIYQNILLESSLKCGKIEQEIIDMLKVDGEITKQDAFGNSIKGLTVGDMHTRLLKKSYTPTVETVKKFANNLTEIGYVTRNDEVRPNRYSINPELKRDYGFSIDWGFVVDSCKEFMYEEFPEYAKEYEERFCRGEGLVVAHPFTGEKVSITAKKETVSSTSVITKSPKTGLLNSQVLDALPTGTIRSTEEIAEYIKAPIQSVIESVAILSKVGSIYEITPDKWRRI